MILRRFAAPVGRLWRAAARARPGAGAFWLAALAGALAALGQAPLGAWWASLPAFAVLLVLAVRAPGPGTAAWLLWAGGAGHFAAALFWIVEPFLVDPWRHVWLAPFALVGMAGGLALFWAAAGYAGVWLADRPDRAVLPNAVPARGAAPASAPGGALLRLVGLVAALGAAELGRGHVLTGFPWAMPGHVWVDTPVAQLAAELGASGLTVLTLALAALLALTVLAGPRLAIAAVPVAAMVLAGGWLWGQGRLAPPAAVAEPAVMLRLVQPNAPQHLKWDPDWIHVFFERQLRLTAGAAGPGGGAIADDPDAPGSESGSARGAGPGASADLVIWPETAIPWLLEHAEVPLRLVSRAAAGAPVVLGAQRGDGTGRYFNSLAVIGAGGAVEAIYDKHHLVPFGEYVPFAGLFFDTPLAGFAGQLLAGFDPGPGPRLLDGLPGGPAAPLICYEAVFPRHLLGLPDRPGWVLQITNDAWFGRVAGPHQHLAQARFRAIEFGLPVVRAANTGISAVIDARGTMRAHLPLGQAGTVEAALPAPLPATGFARRGEAPLALLLALVLAGLTVVRFRR